MLQYRRRQHRPAPGRCRGKLTPVDRVGFKPSQVCQACLWPEASHRESHTSLTLPLQPGSCPAAEERLLAEQ